VGPQEKRIEIQIRTREMDKIANYGYAAHWLYKQGAHDVPLSDLAWLRDMADSIRNVSATEEIEKQAKLSSYIDSVFCFTPHGDIKMLPKGATALDFAYEVHSSIGHHCVGAKINRVIRNIKTELQNGDYVEILTSKTQNPSPEWERFVVTQKARQNIRHYLKNKMRDEIIAYGKSLMVSAGAQYKKDWGDKVASEAANAMKVNSVDELYYLIGAGEYTPEHVMFLLYPELNVGKKSALRSMTRERREKVLSGADMLSNVPIYFAKCCTPLPGDKVLGIVHTGKGITIHKKSCKEISAKALSQAFDLDWSDFKTFSDSTFRTKLTVMTDRHHGALNAVTDVIAKNKGIIYDIRVISRTDDYFDFSITVEVKDIDQLDAIVGELKRVKVVNTVVRRN
jgi:GTP pyrophosphokinase